jgi:proline iminopeptidase
VNGLILRGIFTLRLSEIEWFYQKGASHIFPDYWDEYLAPIPENERHDLVAAYYKRLTSDNEATVLKCAKHWAKWECATSKLLVDPEMIAKTENDTWALAFAKIEAHYFFNKGFFDSDSWILDNIDAIKHIPGIFSF